MRVLIYLFFVLMFLTSPQEGRGWSGPDPSAYSEEDLADIDIYLHTIDVANAIYNNFGHTAIRVHNRRTDLDLVYNWGIFDFGEPLSFALKFYRGILIYKLGIYPFSQVMGLYLYDRRQVWEDKLNLDSSQKRILLARLAWNSQAENRDYAYQYFFDNCATRPRDYINEAFGSQLQVSTSSQASGMRFRDFVADGYQYNPGIDLFLDLVLNRRVDHSTSVWEGMFHPLVLREALLNSKIQGRPAIAESRILVTGSKPQAYPRLSYRLFLGGFGVFLTLCLLFSLKYPFGNGMRRLWPRWFALVGIVLFALGGFLGALMPLTWWISAHLDLHHNANQLLFWPLDAFLCIGLGKLLRSGLRPQWTGRWRILLRTYLLSHIVISLLFPLLYILGFVQQDVSRVIIYVLPPYVLALIILYRLHF